MLFYLCSRLIWLASIMTCLALVLIHGAGLIHRFNSFPTRVQLDVSYRQGIPLPAVTICPLHRFDVDRLKNLWLQTMGSIDTPLNSTEQYYQLSDIIPIEELWSKIAYWDTEALFPMVNCFWVYTYIFYIFVTFSLN